MVKILAVTSGNGGMGKSILACNIACGLCSFGKKVLLAECSFGFRSIDAISGIKAETLIGIQADYNIQVAKSNKSFMERLAKIKKVAAVL